MGIVDPQQQTDFGFADSYTYSAIFEHTTPQLSLVPVSPRMRSWRYRHVKRMIDIIGSMIAIVVCFIPGILIAAAIAASSRGSIFYREIRIGREGRSFRIWKFRSMQANPPRYARVETVHHPEFLVRLRTHKDIHDPRVTWVGQFLRRWSLDELPQLFNVFLGDMSLVGHRPVVSAELRLYEHHLGYYFAATPGMSGLWQVSGRSDVAFSARAKLDASYVKMWSLQGDIAILVRTVPAVLRRVGAR